MAPLDAEVALTDKYRVSRGAALMNGMQALVRMVMEQADADEEAGLNTGGYISGYRGSPIGAFDQELFRVRKELEPRNVVFNPGLNEDLAATAVGGAQHLLDVDDPSVEGVFSVWYGKGPGVDRSLDAMRHVSLAGAHEKGGVLFLLGDDPMCKSSTTAHQSEQAMIHCSTPVFFPASVHEYIPLGLHAFAMSRFSGAPVSMKIVTDTADSAATVLLDRLRPDITLPEKPDFDVPLNWQPGIIDYVLQERRLLVRLEACKAYARANRLNRTVFHATDEKRLGIVAVGRGYADVRQALRLLNLTDEQAAAKGIGLYRMQMVWPVEEKTLLEFARDYDELLIIEEKRPIVEDAAARILVNVEGARPILSGKTDPSGAPLVNAHGELTPEHCADVIARRAAAKGIDGVLAPPPVLPLGNAPGSARSPWFCAGCPHNRSTKLPDGSTAGAGIGCHAMALYMDPNTQYFAQMGAEGMHWVGRSHFAGRKHMFQNLGDGTFTHSGLLAIKAAVAAGTNITYKVLYNDAVA
ncbi:MAG: indolepyruvate ferredoxin oxidoreductase family protein, partial [Pseudomonadota bacterium]